jgi:circadian clock protein KaiC
MAGRDKALIRLLPTGVPGLDEVLGGGLPEYSFNVVGGAPGSGKTTLVHQIMFANISAERPALYFTILGEPPLKMLRYQQQFGFFDPEKVGETVHFVNLAQDVMENDLEAVLNRIVREVEQINPGIVVVDSFRSLVLNARNGRDRISEASAFVQRLSLHLATWEATTFLIGEYEDEDLRSNPVFTVADGILWLTLNTEGNAVVRKIQVRKLRGQGEMPGLHGYRISADGVHVFPRLPPGFEQRELPVQQRRLSTGIPRLNEMTGGGIPAGDVVLVAGPVGSGKSVLAHHFIAAGVKEGEPGVIAMFDERPQQVIHRSLGFRMDMEQMVREGKLGFVYLRPTDLTPAEMLYEILEAVERVGAQRVAIDSLAGLEVALAPTFRQEFRESLCRLVEALVSRGITVMPTTEVIEAYDEFRISPQHPISFAVDDIILQRYIEVNGGLQRILGIVKMRSSTHIKTFHAYDVTPEGLVIGEPLNEYRGLLQGVPEPVPPAARRAPAPPGEGQPPQSRPRRRPRE